MTYHEPLERVRAAVHQLDVASEAWPEDNVYERAAKAAEPALRDLEARLERAERIEAAAQQAADVLPDPMHPHFPYEFVDAQCDAIRYLSDALDLLPVETQEGQPDDNRRLVVYGRDNEVIFDRVYMEPLTDEQIQEIREHVDTQEEQ